jgi:hypothetical protein
MGNASAAETIAVVPRKARRAGSMSWLESFDDIRDLLVRFVAALGGVCVTLRARAGKATGAWWNARNDPAGDKMLA